jgi:hypothetical protein
MKSTSTLALMTLASATTLTGCYSTWDVSPKMLVRLDGFVRGDNILSIPDTSKKYLSMKARHFISLAQIAKKLRRNSRASR